MDQGCLGIHKQSNKKNFAKVVSCLGDDLLALYLFLRILLSRLWMYNFFHLSLKCQKKQYLSINFLIFKCLDLRLSYVLLKRYACKHPYTILWHSTGPKQRFVVQKQEDMYGLLTRRLWDDPSSVSTALTHSPTLCILGWSSHHSAIQDWSAPDPSPRDKVTMSWNIYLDATYFNIFNSTWYWVNVTTAYTSAVIIASVFYVYSGSVPPCACVKQNHLVFVLFS